MIHLVTFLFNELDILDINLNNLSDIVDKFIIVEYPFDHARRERPLYYETNKERFKKFEDKIIHVPDTNSYNGARGLSLMWQRKSCPLILDALSGCNDDDFIVVCDGDVAMKRGVFTDLKFIPTTFVMDWYLYWFNYRNTTQGFAWTAGVTLKDLKMRGAVGNIIGWQPEIQQTLGNAGYHFAKTGGVDSVIENIKGYPHQEFAYDPNLVDPVQVQARIDNGWGWNDYTNGTSQNAKDILAGMVWDKYDPAKYPDYVNQHPEIYSKHFKGGMNIE